MKHHLILDFETFGQDVHKCAVIDVSVMVFDWDRFCSDNPYTYKDIELTKRFKLSVKDQTSNYDYEIQKDTIEFWEQQEKEVRTKITPKPDDLTVKEFTDQFLDFLIDGPKIEYWWSRSNTFDPVILERLFKSQGKVKHMQEHLKYWAVRDTRTWIDAKLNFPKTNGFTPVNREEWDKVFKKHDSSWDILADVLRMQFIDRIENDVD